MKITTKYNKGQRVFWKKKYGNLIMWGEIADVKYDRGEITYYIDAGQGRHEVEFEENLYANIEDVPLEDEQP